MDLLLASDLSFVTEDFATSDPAALFRLPSLTMDSIEQLLHLRQGGLSIKEYVHQFGELSDQVPLYDEILFKDLFHFGLNEPIKSLHKYFFLVESLRAVWAFLWTMHYNWVTLFSYGCHRGGSRRCTPSGEDARTRARSQDGGGEDLPPAPESLNRPVKPESAHVRPAKPGPARVMSAPPESPGQDGHHACGYASLARTDY